MANYFDNQQLSKVVLKQKCLRYDGSRISTTRIFSFFPIYNHEKSLAFKFLNTEHLKVILSLLTLFSDDQMATHWIIIKTSGLSAITKNIEYEIDYVYRCVWNWNSQFDTGQSPFILMIYSCNRIQWCVYLCSHAQSQLHTEMAFPIQCGEKLDLHIMHHLWDELEHKAWPDHSTSVLDLTDAIVSL